MAHEGPVRSMAPPSFGRTQQPLCARRRVPPDRTPQYQRRGNPHRLLREERCSTTRSSRECHHSPVAGGCAGGGSEYSLDNSFLRSRRSRRKRWSFAAGMELTSCQALPNESSLLCFLRAAAKRSSPGSRRRRTRQGASTTSHSGIRGLLRVSRCRAAVTVLRREVTLSYLANPEGVFLSHSCGACPPYRAYLRPSTSNPSKSKSSILEP